MNKNKIPEGWKVKKLGEIGKVVNGLIYSPENIVEEGGVLVLRSSNIKNDKLVFEDNVFVDVDKYNPVEIGDILICVRNGSKNLIGKNTIITKKVEGVAFGAFMTIYRSEYNSFIHHWMKGFDYKKYIDVNLGATINSINGSDLKNFKVSLPPKEEMQKIASILSTWDKTIEKQEQLIQEKKTYKQGVMQQLLTGKKRFKGFTDKWKEVKLGDVGKIMMCKRIFAIETSEREEIPFFKIGTLGYNPDSFISRELFEKYKAKYNYPKEGDVLITCSGTVGRCVPFDGKDAYFQDSNIVWIDNNEKTIINKYLNSILNIVNWDKLNSTTITRIYTSDLKEIKKLIPNSLAEQEKIASVLSGMDKEIEILEKELEALRVQKRGLMQQLLTGKVRV